MKKLIFSTMILALSLAACTFPGAGATPTEETSPEEIAQTMVAQTQAAEAAAVTDTPIPPTNTATPEGTTTPSTTTVSVSVATNCRTGPDVAYPLVLVFQPGATAEVVGKYQAPNYWITKTPTNETCWLWGQYATVEGDTSTLPEMAAPAPPVIQEAPTATPDNGQVTPGVIVVSIAAPNNFTATATCQVLDLGGGQQMLQSKMDKMTWTPVNGATGYKIYVNGTEHDTVGGGAASYNIDALKINGEYGIASFNASSTSTIKTIPVPSCP